MSDEMTFVLYPESEDEMILPAKYVVCENCQGKGSHVNRAIDGHGLTHDDFAEDPDFAESYFADHYDVPCDECHGKRVELVPDLDRCTKAQAQAYEYFVRDEIAYAQECAMERRMGC